MVQQDAQDLDRKKHGNKNPNMYYITSPFQKPREKDLPGLRLSRAECDNGIFRDPPPLTLPAAAPGHVYWANREDVRKGIKFGRKNNG